jgi:YfiH family protein
MIPFIQSDALKQLVNIHHGFTTRQGGVSTGCFDSLNVAKNKGDFTAHVIENLRRIAVTFQVSPENLITLNQTHTNKVEIVDESWTSTTLKEADALVTRTPGKLLGVMTADCVPVLLTDPHNNVIAAVHAGWRGAVTGIIQNTIAAMVSCGAESSLIQAAIGPCIWQSSYEVDQHFYKSLPQAADLFIPSNRPDHWLFDLPGFVKRTLSQEKITTITPSLYDTYRHPEMFFSCRRKTHLNEENFGCSLSVITLR